VGAGEQYEKIEVILMHVERTAGHEPMAGTVNANHSKDLIKLAEEFSAIFMKSVFESGFDSLLPKDNPLQAKWADTMWCKLAEPPFPLTVYIMKILTQQNIGISCDQRDTSANPSNE
jgi:hypothetical protein